MLIKFLYNVAFFFFALFYLPTFLLKGKHRYGFLSRFGVVPKKIKQELKNKFVVWVHGVSVGETAQGLKLAEAIRAHSAETTFIFTTTTDQGLEFAHKHKSAKDYATFLPVDFRGSVRAFLKSVSPKALVILETEIWPNLIGECTDRRIPVFIVNARISEKTISQYKKIKKFIAPILNRLTGIYTQDETMCSRFLELGAEADRVRVTGNMKFDLRTARREPVVERVEERLKGSNVFLCVAGSTHEGEEKLLFGAHQSISRQYPFFRLMIAPRHLNRLAAIQECALREKIALKTLSQFLAHDSPNGNAAFGNEVVLVDRVGILADLYRLADLVIVGGSFLPKIGGHNIAEPAFYEKPILFGPFMDNFKEVAEEFSRQSAAIQVPEARALEEEIILLLNDKDKRNFLGKRAKDVVLEHEGATRKNAELVVANGGL